MKSLLLVLGLACPAFADVALSLTGGLLGTATTPASSLFLANNVRIEGRIVSLTSESTGYESILESGAFAIRQVPGTRQILFQTNSQGAYQIPLDATGYTDFMFRWQRQGSTGLMTLDLFNTLTGACSAVAAVSGSYSGNLDLRSTLLTAGDAATNVEVRFIRAYSDASPVARCAPLNPNVAGGNLWDWEFQTDSNDASGNGVNLTFPSCSTWSTCTASVSANPPVGLITGASVPLTTLAGVPAIVMDRAVGASVTATVYTLNGSPSVSCVWSQTSQSPLVVAGSPGPAITASFSGTSCAGATITANHPGTITVQVAATDSTPRTTDFSLTIGAVTNSAGVIQTGYGGCGGGIVSADCLMGPMTMWGTSPWPWYDSVEKADADALFAAGGIPSAPPWGSNAAGTISVTNVTAGGAWLTATGSGTSFTTLSACNGTDSIVIKYQLANSSFGARPFTVMSCSSNTVMVIQQWNTSSALGYNASAPQSGLNYALVNNSQTFGWTSTTTTWNYYDAVLATYRLYYRTGLIAYLTDARQFADNWYIFPLDGGRSYNNAGFYALQGARSPGLLGMMMRAIDGQSGYWLDSAAAGAPLDQYSNSISGIKGMVDDLFGAYVTSFFASPYDALDTVDARETGYALKFSIMYAALGPTGGTNQTPSADISSGVGTYASQNHAAILGSNSLASRYHSGYGFTTNADPTSASGGSTAYGYSGGKYQGSAWLSVFLEKALIAYIQTVPADLAAASTLLQNSFNDWFRAHYFGGVCRGITYSSSYTSCDVGLMPVNPSNGLPPGSLAFSGTSVTGTGTVFEPIAITAASSTNPMVITTASAVGIPNGTSITISGAAGAGCSIMNLASVQVTVVSGTSLTLPLNGIPCTYVPNSASVASFFANAGVDYIGLPYGNGNFLMQAINSGGITSATSLTTAIAYAGGTASTAAYDGWGYASKCAAASGVTGAPPVSYSTLAFPISNCSPVGYGNAERAVAELAHEVNGFLYQLTGLTQYLTQGDAMFSAGYGCGSASLGCLSGGTGLGSNITGGGVNADGGAGNFGDLLYYVVDSQNGRGKEFASNSGAGLADTYLAYRLGGAAPVPYGFLQGLGISLSGIK